MSQIPESSKHALDLASVGTAVGTVLGWLPYVAALFTIIWTGLRIWENETFQKMLSKLKKK